MWRSGRCSWSEHYTECKAKGARQRVQGKGYKAKGAKGAKSVRCKVQGARCETKGGIIGSIDRVVVLVEW